MWVDNRLVSTGQQAQFHTPASVPQPVRVREIISSGLLNNQSDEPYLQYGQVLGPCLFLSGSGNNPARQ